MGKTKDKSREVIPVDIHLSKQELKTGIEALKLPFKVDDITLNDFIRYMILMLKWNRSYNLTAVRKPTDIIRRHFLDCLAVAPYICGNKIIDVGSGAGLPGIVLALVYPKKHFVLLDSNGKKARFLLQVKTELALNNVTVVQERVEDYQTQEFFDVIITRAFGNIQDILAMTERLCRPGGQIIAMKGVYPGTEIADLKKEHEVVQLFIPFLDGERHLICIKKEE
jgi:16S rRNA (guanine527-N7)-methyltransferase